MKKRWLSLLLALVMVLQLLAPAVPRVAAMETGSCGDEVHWYAEFNYDMMMGYDLEISGLGGAMSNYSDADDTPWSSYFPIYSVYISGVSTIGSYAFANLDTSNVSWPSGLVSIGDYAFADAGITRANLYEGLQTIGEGAFSGSDLSSLTLPNTVTFIGKSAFADCTSLSDVTLSEGLTVIPENAFRNTGISEIIIPDSVTTVETGAFAACRNLMKVTIPESVTFIDYEAFPEIPDLVVYGTAGSYAEAWAADYGYTFESLNGNRCGDNVTYTIDGDTATFTGTGAMYDLTWNDERPWASCTNVIVGEGITHLGNYMFESCAVETITLPNTVLTIGDAAFCCCYDLKNISLSANLVSIGSIAFYECVELTQILLPDTLKSIDASAFERSSLAEITIPASVQNIGEYAFLLIPGIVYVEPGSYAEQYARDAGISYAVLDHTPPAIGSVSPNHGTTITGPMTITVTVSDNIGLDHVTMNGVDYAVSGCEATVEIPYDPTAYYPGYHYLDIYAYDLSGNSVSEFYWLVYVTGPEAPTGLTAKESKEGIALSWNLAEVETVTGYLLQRATDGVNFEDIATPDLDAVSYVDTDTLSGVTYTYRLYPLWDQGEGDFAQVSCTYGDYVAPEAPTVTVSPEISGGTVNPTVSVSAEDDLALDRVVLSLADSGEQLAELFNGNQAATFRQNWPWTVAGLESGSYSICAVAYDAAGNASEETIVAITVDNTAPPSPTGFYTEATTGYIHVMWDTDYPVPDDFVRFELYRSDAPDGDFTLVSSGTGVGYYDQSTSIDAETTYYYYAVAVDRLGNVSQPTELCQAQLLTDEESPVIVDMAPVSNSTVCKEVTLQVSAMDNYRLGEAVFYYLDGAEWVEIGTDAADGISNSAVFSINWSVPEHLSGTITVKAEVYDTSDNAPAVQTRILNVLTYELPVEPEITVETGFQRATLSWSYDKDLLRTLRHFVIYQTDSNGGSRSHVATVSRAVNSKYTLSIEKDVVKYYVVEAVDCYGAVAASQVLEVISAPDTTAPTAQLRAAASLAAIGQEIVFSGELSGDNDGIAAWEWDFNGDGIVDQTGERCSHSFDEAGTYTVTLTVRDHSGNEAEDQVTVEICDTESENSDYTQIWITVVNAYAEDVPPVSGAEVTVTVDSHDFEVVGFTDPNGLVKLTIPRADCMVYVAADGFASTTRAVAAVPRNHTGVTVSMMPMDVSVLSGELTVKEMTYEEIVDAGIDVTAPGNEHVFTFQTELTFVAAPGMKGMTITPVSLVNTRGEILNSVNNWLDVELPDSNGDTTLGPDVEVSDPNISTSDTARVGFFPISEHFVLVVYGQTHWLKEMFNVELMVLNNNYLEPITDCEATLNLPEGLSLADMVDGVQTEVVRIGDIGCNGSEEGNTAKVKWYVRGDEAGSYGLTASVTGMVGEEPFVNTFTCEDLIQVYAGTALELTVYADDHTFRDVDYHMVYKLENVSDKPLYNVSLQIDKTELSHNFHAISVSTGELGVATQIIQTKDLPADGSITFKEVKPGEAIFLDLYCQPLFLSLGHLADIGPLDIAYYLAKIVTVASDGSTTSIPCKSERMKVTHGSLKESAKDAVEDEVVDKGVDFAADQNDLGNTNTIKDAVKIYEFFTEMGDRLNSVPTLTIYLDRADGRFIDTHPSTPAPFALRTTGEDAPLLVYTDSEDYVVEEYDGYAVMTITGDAKVYVLGENPGDAELTMTTWAQSYAYNEETDTMDVVKRDITYTANYHIHSEVIDEAEAATCEETGLTEGKHCGVCGEVLVAQDVVQPLGHNYINGVCTNCGASTAPVITGQPTDASAKLGEGFCATVEAVGNGLKYQWYFRNKGSDQWYTSGQRDNTYDDIMTKARMGREIYCVITDAQGNSVETDHVFLIAVPTQTLAIVAQPTTQETCMGEGFCATVEAVGDGLKFQWYFRNKGTDRWYTSGQRDNTYDDIMTKARMGREIYCVITDMWGNRVETDHVFLNAVPTQTLAIVTQPTTQEVCMDEDFCASVEAVGDGLKFQWYFRNKGSDQWYTSGQRDNTYDDIMTKARMGREVYCVITDFWGNTVETDHVLLNAVPRVQLAITSQPTDASTEKGERFCVTVEAQGDGLRYTWYFKNKGSNAWNKSGVTDNTYDDIMTNARAERQVYCVITDAFGNQVTTETVTIHMAK